MIMRCESGKTWPYPTRSVELVEVWKKEDFDVEVISLTVEEKEVLNKLDEGLFEELKQLKKKKVTKSERAEGEVEQRRAYVKAQYWERKGDVLDFPEIVRTTGVADESELEAKIKEFRGLKTKIKNLILEMDGEDSLARASAMVLDMYRRYINVSLAELNYSKVESLKNAERMDKFIRGVFFETDKNGNFVSLGSEMKKEIEKIEDLPGEKFNYPDVWLDEDDIEIVANVMLKHLDIQDWKVVRRSSDKSTFGVYKPKKEIRIGKNMKRRLEDVLPVIAHEIEGHVMSAVSEKKSGYTPKVMEVYSAGGRDGILSEMMGRWVEDETRKLLGIDAKIPENLYFRTLEKKKSGATFVECFDFYFREYLMKQSIEFDKAMEDGEIFERCFDHVYDRVMRLFRKNSPLNERSGYLSTTDQLKYVEQYLVLKKLIDLDLEDLMFLDGADLYSAKQIKELGLLEDIESIRPKFVLAKEIWPVIKKGIGEGRNIKEILEEIR